MAHKIDFEVIESLDDFFYSDKFISLVVGPIGSTKTTAGIMKILHHAGMMAAGTDGIRRSKAVWVRNTREQLRDTSIPDFMKWIPDGVMGSFLKTEYKFLIKIADIECEVLFRGLDDANDVRRLLSLNASFFIFDEFREIHPEIFETAQGRVGRYPDGMLVPHRPEWGLDAKGNPIQGCVTDDGKPNKLVWGMSNPPDIDTYWETLLSDPPENVHVTIQPGGLDPEADWIRFLPTDYYDNLAQGKSEDWVDVYIHAKFGKSLSGQPVFRSFERTTHVAKEPLKPLTASTPLIIGVDAGLTPAAVIGQVIHDGRVLIYDALISDGMGALRFIRERLKPLLANKFPGHKSVVIIDPAAFQRAQTDERTVADIYKAEGFTVKPSRTNSIAARIAAVDKYLTRTVDGKAGILLCPEGAQPLVQALAGKYRYKINTKGERDETPEKSHPWSDVCFVAGTPVLTPAGYVPVETLRPGDSVLSYDGTETVTATGVSYGHSLVELTLSDGTVLTCTSDHPFAVNNHTCFIPADTLTCEHVLLGTDYAKWANGHSLTPQNAQLTASVLNAVQSSLPRHGELLKEKESTALKGATDLLLEAAMGLNTTACGSPELATISTTGTSVATKLASPCTSMFGKNTMGRHQKDLSSTTSTTIRLTTTSGTSLLSAVMNTLGTIWKSVSPTAHLMLNRLWRKLGKQQKRGTALKKEESGIVSTLTVVSIKPAPAQNVYNLTTSGTHTYYAGPALVHNCDAIQYFCLHADGGETFGTSLATKRREVKAVSAVGWT